MFTVISLVIQVGTLAGDPPSPQYKFVEDISRHVSLLSGDAIMYGHLDRRGNFVPRFSLRAGSGGSGLPPSQLINGSFGSQVYEFRSGRLVKGIIEKGGRFVPNLGTEIIDFKEYKFAPDAIPIYNLPGYFIQVQSSAKDKK